MDVRFPTGKFAFSLALAAWLFVSPPTLAQASSASTAPPPTFATAKAAAMLAKFQKQLAEHPDDTVTLYNVGLAAYLAGRYTLAEQTWQHLATLTPNDLQVHDKLLQTYQKLGRLADRNRERDRVIALWNALPVDKRKFDMFCVDQYTIDGKKVMAFETYQHKDHFGTRYRIYVTPRSHDEPEYKLTIESSEVDNDYARSTHEIKPDERIYSLDQYLANGTHVTWKLFSASKQPAYATVRKMVDNVIMGKSSPISSSTPAGEQRPGIESERAIILQHPSAPARGSSRARPVR